jgi:hypothetical protein
VQNFKYGPSFAAFRFSRPDFGILSADGYLAILRKTLYNGRCGFQPCKNADFFAPAGILRPEKFIQK